MDKKVIFAVAGSGKTTYVLEQLSTEKRSLIITYTNNNVNNLKKGVIEKFGFLPKNITILSYFSFIYSFCFRPLLSYKYRVKGINYKENPNKYIPKIKDNHYIDKNNRIYGNRISKFIENKGESKSVNARIEKYFDELFIDEIQDFAGNDFNFLKKLSEVNIDVLFVGDFYQHTFDTSRDGNINKNLHKNKEKYKKEFQKMGLEVDEEILINSYRCSPTICEFIENNMKIIIKSHREDDTEIKYINNEEEIINMYNNNKIIKLFYQESNKYSCFSDNWGRCKGETYDNVCVVLNKTTMKLYNQNNLLNLSESTKNKFYVACSRTRNNLFFIEEDKLKNLISK